MTTNAAFTAGLEAKLQQLRDDKVYKRLNFLDSQDDLALLMERISAMRGPREFFSLGG